MSELNKEFKFGYSGREKDDLMVVRNGHKSESLPTIRGTAGVGGVLVEPSLSFEDGLTESFSESDVLEKF